MSFCSVRCWRGLDAWVAVSETAGALGDLLLLDGDDVDWDAVELFIISLAVSLLPLSFRDRPCLRRAT